MDNKKYQIFISSTYNDLRDARDKVQDAILSMYHFPVGMELFGAASAEQWEIIKDTIDSSDYYVLIIGHRYGTVIKEGKDTGISYTEKEFRYAKKIGVPILAFIISDTVSVTPDKIESDAKAKKKLKAFIEEVKTGRSVVWWTGLDDLAQKVTVSLYKEFNRTRRPGWVRSDKFDIEASHAELLQLNKEVWKLQEENSDLKSKLVDRKAALELKFYLAEQPEPSAINPTDDPKEDEIYSHGNLLLDCGEDKLKVKLIETNAENLRNQFEPYTREIIDELGAGISQIITDNKIKKYNEGLPPKSEIDAYINNCDKYIKMYKGGIPIEPQIENNGSGIANNIKIIIEVPDELILYDVTDVPFIKEPEPLKMPKDIIREAERDLERRFNPVASYIDQMALPSYGISPGINLAELTSSIRPMNIHQTMQTEIESHSIEFRCDRIQHKDSVVMDAVYLVPMKRGKFQIKCEIMCDEYSEPVVKFLDIEVV